MAEGPRRQRSLTAYRTHPVAEAPAALTMSGIEAPLANWITDAMRLATGADLALYNRRSYRGCPCRRGRWTRWTDPVQPSVRAVPGGGGHDGWRRAQHLESECHPDEGLEFIVQVSGASYTFDWGRPVGRRVVEHTIDTERRYRVVLEGMCRSEDRVARCIYPASARGFPTGSRTCHFGAALYAHAVRSGRSRRRSRGACGLFEDSELGPHSLSIAER